jgi:vacuolar-type H+-ATPase subunit D/Vma8
LIPAAPVDPSVLLLERRRDALLVEFRQVQRELEGARRQQDEAAWHDRIKEALIVLPELEGEDELASRRTTQKEPLEG